MSECNIKSSDCFNTDLKQLGVNPVNQKPTASENAFDNRFGNLGDLKTQDTLQTQISQESQSGGARKSKKNRRSRKVLSLKNIVKSTIEIPNNIKNTFLNIKIVYTATV